MTRDEVRDPSRAHTLAGLQSTLMQRLCLPNSSSGASPKSLNTELYLDVQFLSPVARGKRISAPPLNDFPALNLSFPASERGHKPAAPSSLLGLLRGCPEILAMGGSNGGCPPVARCPVCATEHCVPPDLGLRSEGSVHSPAEIFLRILLGGLISLGSDQMPLSWSDAREALINR